MWDARPVLLKKMKDGKWRKILYEDQGVADNFVPDSFLEDLKQNLYIRRYDYWTVVIESGVVTQQLSCVVIFVAVFVYMDQKWLSPDSLLIVSSVLTFIGYLIYSALLLKSSLQCEPVSQSVIDDIKTVVVFTSFSYGLSPVLVSLTETISTDTIYAMTTVMLLANLLFHDYGANAAIVSGALSLNAAIFASVCLASRLNTTWHAFATVTCSVELFALFPVLRRKMKRTIPRSQIILTSVLGVGAFTCLAAVSVVYTVLFTSLHLFISFMCPAWLLWLQPYKNNIYGPWDEATIKD